jgi:uncharacterized membrane protein YphA (DoxX/SURF4 family)
MSTDVTVRGALAPLLLRVALGVILIYHGWTKILPQENDWGTAWAEETWKKQAQPPEDVLKKVGVAVGKVKGLTDEQMKKVEGLSAEQKQTGEGLTEEQKALVGLFKGLSAEQKQRVKDFSETQARTTQKMVPEFIKTEYNRDSELPAALEYSAAQMAVAWGELLGGVALLLGALTRLAAAGVIIIQLGAVYTVTAYKGFASPRVGGAGYDYNIALLAMCLALIVLGAGALSVDHWLAERRTRHKARVAAGAQPVAGAAS